MGSKMTVPRQGFGQLAGLVLYMLGMVMILVAALRFARNAREIDTRRCSRAPVGAWTWRWPSLYCCWRGPCCSIWEARCR